MAPAAEEYSRSGPDRPGAPKKVRRSSATDTDRIILDALIKDARIPNNAIAAAAGIAPSTCLGRIRAMERSGVITGYHADVNLAALGRPMQAMISVRLRAGARHRLAEFMEQMRSRPEVRSVYFLGGSDDFMIHLAIADSEALREFVLDQLSAREDIAATQTNVIFEHVRGSAP